MERPFGGYLMEQTQDIQSTMLDSGSEWTGQALIA